MGNKPYIIELEKIGSPSLGYITVAEYQKNVPFEIKRVQLNKISEQALAEYDEMKRNPSAYKRYADFKELENELSTDV